MKFLFSLTIIVLALSTTAFAGKEGGGGVGFQCPDRTYLADTYSLLYQPIDPRMVSLVEYLNKKTPDQLVDLFFKGMKQRLAQENNLAIYNGIETARSHVSFKYVSHLALSQDHHLTSADIPCQGGKIVQLARQDGKGDVRVIKNVKTFSSLEQGFLRMHEIRLRYLIENKSFAGDTTPVRKWVDEFTKMSVVKFIDFAFIKSGFGPLHDSNEVINPDGTYNWKIVSIEPASNAVSNFVFGWMQIEGSNARQSFAYEKKDVDTILQKLGLSSVQDLVGYHFTSLGDWSTYALDVYRIELITGHPYVVPTGDEILKTIAGQVAQMKCPDYTYIDQYNKAVTFNNGYDFDLFKNYVNKTSHGTVTLKEIVNPSRPDEPHKPFTITDGTKTLIMDPLNGLRCRGGNY